MQRCEEALLRLVALALIAFLHAIPFARAAPGICLMQYLVADNDLENAITTDLLELVDSPYVKRRNVQTWVFYDAHGDMYDYDEDGLNEAPLSDSNGPILLWNDQAAKKLEVVAIFEESDLDTPDVLCYFLITALTDCIKNGSEEFVLTFSSHGGGHVGFGGDVNHAPPPPRRRKLYQSNADVASGIRCALESVAYAPSKFDLIGFDACLMGSYLALREYAPLARGLLASQANVPEHGWYWNMPRTAADSAWATGMALQSSYLNEAQNPQGDPGRHATPKTLALIDTSGFDAFAVAFEAFARELTYVLKWNDRNFHASVGRTRNGILAFESADDPPGTSHPSAVDVGSFLAVFRERCVPNERSAVGRALEGAVAAYDAQFVARGVGPGTKPATGMSVYFPSKVNWDIDAVHRVDYSDKSNAWLQFLITYLTSSTPAKNEKQSICRTSFESDVEPSFEGQLLLDPEIFVSADDDGDGDATGAVVSISSDIAINADVVRTTYGFAETTETEGGGAAGRRTAEIARVHRDMRQTPRHRHHHHAAAAPMKQPRARLRPHKADVGEGDTHHTSIVMLNGELAANYDGPAYSCAWNGAVYLAHGTIWSQTSGLPRRVVESTALYVTALGDGARNVPALYFPWHFEMNSDDALPPFATPAVDALGMGAYLATIHFTVDEATGEILSPISLYKSALPGEERGAMYEVARGEGGFVVPLLYAEAYTSNGDDVDAAFPGEQAASYASLELVGDVHGWDDGFGILPVDAATYSGTASLDSMVFTVRAWDLDRSDEEATKEEEPDGGGGAGGSETRRFAVPVDEIATEGGGTVGADVVFSEQVDVEDYGGSSGDGTVYGWDYPTFYPTRGETLAPSPVPSRGPSSSPVQFPTDTPTKEPFTAPSSSPSDFPTDLLTPVPSSSRSPTVVATKPSRAPSPSPSNLPTDIRSHAPTSNQSPIDAPSEEPSKASSRSPSNFPTSILSYAPSSSQSPIDVPSKEPIKDETKAPTSPTESPLAIQSGVPSSRLVESPTDAPTKEVIIDGTPDLNYLFGYVSDPKASSSQSPPTDAEVIIDGTLDLNYLFGYVSEPIAPLSTQTEDPGMRSDAPSSSKSPPTYAEVMVDKAPYQDYIFGHLLNTKAPSSISTEASSMASHAPSSSQSPMNAPAERPTNDKIKTLPSLSPFQPRNVEFPKEQGTRTAAPTPIPNRNVEFPKEQGAGTATPTPIPNDTIGVKSKETNSSRRCILPFLVAFAIPLIHLLQ